LTRQHYLHIVPHVPLQKNYLSFCSLTIFALRQWHFVVGYPWGNAVSNNDLRLLGQSHKLKNAIRLRQSTLAEESTKEYLPKIRHVAEDRLCNQAPSNALGKRRALAIYRDHPVRVTNTDETK